MRLRSRVIVLAFLVFLLPIAAAADDGPTLYKQLCESCHDLYDAAVFDIRFITDDCADGLIEVTRRA